MCPYLRSSAMRGSLQEEKTWQPEATMPDSHDEEQQTRCHRQSNPGSIGNLLTMLNEMSAEDCGALDDLLIQSTCTSTTMPDPGGGQQLDCQSPPNKSVLDALKHEEEAMSNNLAQRLEANGQYCHAESMQDNQTATQFYQQASMTDFSSPSPDRYTRTRSLSSLSSDSSEFPTTGERSPTRGNRDDKYWERRRKNNMAAKKSRDARRVRENQLRLKVLCLENANGVLRAQVKREQEENMRLRDRVRCLERDKEVKEEVS